MSKRLPTAAQRRCRTSSTAVSRSKSSTRISRPVSRLRMRYFCSCARRRGASGVGARGTQRRARAAFAGRGAARGGGLWPGSRQQGHQHHGFGPATCTVPNVPGARDERGTNLFRLGRGARHRLALMVLHEAAIWLSTYTASGGFGRQDRGVTVLQPSGRALRLARCHYQSWCARVWAAPRHPPATVGAQRAERALCKPVMTHPVPRRDVARGAGRSATQHAVCGMAESAPLR